MALVMPLAGKLSSHGVVPDSETLRRTEVSAIHGDDLSLNDRVNAGAFAVEESQVNAWQLRMAEASTP